jgi:hypothetical protein
MKIYVVWFPRVGGFVGKRGRVEENIERAVMFWEAKEAKEWAEVLGGEVRAFEEAATERGKLPVEEPF